MLDKDIKKILVSEEEIFEKSKELGQIIAKEYADKKPLLVGILKGSIPFMAELIKHIDAHIETDYMVVSSYHGGTESSRTVKIVKELDNSVAGRHIIFVEDIIDTGRTLKELKELFALRQAASIKIATLLDKPEVVLLK